MLNSAKGIAESVAILYSIRNVDVSGDARKKSKVISTSIQCARERINNDSR